MTMAPKFFQSLRRKSKASLLTLPVPTSARSDSKSTPHEKKSYDVGSESAVSYTHSDINSTRGKSKTSNDVSSESAPNDQLPSTMTSSFHSKQTSDVASAAISTSDIVSPTTVCPPPRYMAAATSTTDLLSQSTLCLPPRYMAAATSTSDLLSQSPGRTPLTSATSNRQSVAGMSGLGGPVRLHKLPTSQYQPRVTSYDYAPIVIKTFYIHGEVGDVVRSPIDGVVIISKVNGTLPPMRWEVNASRFKALLPCEPGDNCFRLEFTSSKLANSTTSNNPHISHLKVSMIPSSVSPPLHLVILMGKDSPGTFDATPARIEKEGNGLETAIQKFRMGAYLWQAFTGEQMARACLGHRGFQFEEEWTMATSNLRDRSSGNMRYEAKVHVVQCAKTVTELRDSGLAKDDMVTIVHDALKEYFNLPQGQKLHTAVLLLDAQWDSEAKVVAGHVPFGGSIGDINLAMFGSHMLSTYPTCFEEVGLAFLDCSGTYSQIDANNESKEAGSAWEACSSGIGGHLHEIGRLFGCPRQESGIMAGDYLNMNRFIMTREPSSTRTEFRGSTVFSNGECKWHYLDLLRFEHSSLFAVPQENPKRGNSFVHAWPVENGKVLLTAMARIQWLEIRTEGDDLCHQWRDWTRHQCRKVVTITEQELRDHLPEDRRKLRMRVTVFSYMGGKLDIPDFGYLVSKNLKLKLPNGQAAYRSPTVGGDLAKAGSRYEELVFHSAVQQKKLMIKVVVHHGPVGIDGLEFVYEDSSTQLFGKRDGTTASSEVSLGTRRVEFITGFDLRPGDASIDAIAIITSAGIKSNAYGNVKGQPRERLLPPRPYIIAGVFGSFSSRLDSFGIIHTR